ncbi:MAG: tail fiber protein [Magnetospirillum sp.]|nr:tail fiber protein [Magnetospirillum sp.]
MSSKVIFGGASGISALALAAILSVGGANEAQACATDPLLGTVCFMATNYCPVGYVQANGQTMTIQSNQALNALFGTMYGGDGKTTFGIPDLRGRSPAGVTGPTTSGGTAISFLNYGQMRGQEATTLNTMNLPPHNHAATFTGTGGGGGSGSGTASGTVTLPVTGSAASQSVSVSGSLKIANATTTGGQVPADGAVLTKAGGGQGAVYAPAGTTANLNIGPSQTFTGTLPAGTVTGSATGNVSLPVTGGGGGITGGTVTVGNTGGGVAFTNLPPQIGLTVCVATQGLWPSRPQ